MPRTPTRRQVLPTPLLAFTAVAIAGLATGNLAVALTLPKFEDLRQKWSSVRMGDTEAEVVKQMGEPSSRAETQTMGLVHQTLV